MSAGARASLTIPQSAAAEETANDDGASNRGERRGDPREALDHNDVRVCNGREVWTDAHDGRSAATSHL